MNLKLLMCKPGLTGNTTGATVDLTPGSSSAKGWLIKNLMFYNYNPAPVSIDLKIRQGANYRMISKGVFTIATGTDPTIIEKEIALDLNGPDVLAAFLIAPLGTATMNLDCVINGVEADQ